MALLLKVKKFVSQRDSGTAAYHLLRAVYQSAFNRDWVRRRVARQTFYREFIRRGSLVFDVGANTGHSTVSEEWVKTASKNGPEFRWNIVVKCSVNTLDSLYREHGAPDFIKIDVEGFELSVLRGMSFRPSALSFEFHAFSPEQFRECLLLPMFDFRCSFNISLGDEWQFVWPDWRDKQAVLDYASTLTGNTFGDVYVKFS